MADIKAVSRHWSEHAGFGVILFLLGHRPIARLAAASVIDTDIVQVYLFNIVSRDAGDLAAVFRVGVVNPHIADGYPAQFANRCSLRTTHTRAKTKEDRGVGDIAHGDIADGNI